MIAKEDAIEVLCLLTTWRVKFMKMGDLSGNEVMVLRAIINRREQGEPDFTMSMLSETIDATKSAVSQLIGKLEEKGFVERYMAKGDRRVVCVKMTDGGKSSYGTFRKGLDGMFNQYVQMMGEDDTETLIRLIKKSDEVFSKLVEEKK